MQTTPEISALLDDLYERCEIVADLSGPQIEAWVSGLFPVFDNDLTATMFVDHCASQQTAVAATVIAAIAELSDGLDADLGAHVQTILDDMEVPAIVEQVGTSELTGTWSVTAPFGRSIVLGFDNPRAARVSADDLARGLEPIDLRHSILIEVDEHGALQDIQLAGPSKELLEEAADSDHRVVVTAIDVGDAVADIVSAWPTESVDPRRFGPGLNANQQFVRRRLLMLHDVALSQIVSDPVVIDVRRGLNDDEFAAANRAAISTLKAALRIDSASTDDAEDPVAATAAAAVVVAVIHGDGGELALRERDALLWLEWADWLGAGIGLWRAGSGSAADGATLVDHVNRCPEVSSTISKADRDYAEWAFEVALDLLEDAGVVADGVLTDTGYAALAPAMFSAWS